jgi:hypothetical protein
MKGKQVVLLRRISQKKCIEFHSFKLGRAALQASIRIGSTKSRLIV